MTPIVTLTIQQTIKPVVVDDVDKFEQLSFEVQQFEISKLLGDALYNDMLDNITDAKYVKLITGDSWTVNGRKYVHNGLQTVIAYINYSKWLYRSQVIESYTGAVIQKSDYADRAQEGYIKQLSDEARQYAMEEWAKVEQYIIDHADDYPYYCTSESRKTTKPIVTTLRRY